MKTYREPERNDATEQAALFTGEKMPGWEATTSIPGRIWGLFIRDISADSSHI